MKTCGLLFAVEKLMVVDAVAVMSIITIIIVIIFLIVLAVCYFV